MSGGPVFTPTTTRTLASGNDQRIFKFDNGYSASVVRGPYTYGGDQGLYELAVIGPDGHLTYDTSITNDVIGWLDDDAVHALLVAVADLPPVTP